MLGQRPRRWHNIEVTPVERRVFLEMQKLCLYRIGSHVHNYIYIDGSQQVTTIL